ncbi:MAG: ribose 5-phosphate isomerase B [Alphaproteobacteria bacterium]|nr:ribose 5-phosphate isomerase B [Alphaproteobacteria bacterium]
MPLIFIASDHAGFELKQYLIETLNEDIRDLGTYSAESCDYPMYANKLTEEVLHNSNSVGILICGSGIGMSIVANRKKGIRAALCFNKETAELARKHNDANVLVLGARFISKEHATECIQIFLHTQFEGGRHLRRIQQIDA